jgi:hypothetical protein
VQLRREYGFAVLFITHDLALPLEVCDTMLSVGDAGAQRGFSGGVGPTATGTWHTAGTQ